MSLKKHLKYWLKMFIESGGNPITMIINLSKKRLLHLVDRVLPDEEVEKQHYIDVTYNGGKPAKMMNIFFGDVLLQLPTGEKTWLSEKCLDHDWRSKS